jgi:hypothetical protein
MTEPEGMDELRERLRRAEDDARAARYLAGGADRDTAELRTEVREFRAEFREYKTHNNGVLNAMREDLVDLREQMNRGFAQADQNFLAVRGQLDGVTAFLRIVAERLPDANGDD